MRRMTYYRFITPHRTGQWYRDLAAAQAHACAIGAGFLSRMGERFVAYQETRLETADYLHEADADMAAGERPVVWKLQA